MSACHSRRFQQVQMAAVAAGSLLGLAFGSAPASTIHWIRGGNGSFLDAANWNPAVVPGSDDIAVFDMDQISTVTFNTPVINKQAIFDQGDITFSLTPSDSDSDPYLYTLVGYKATGFGPGMLIGSAAGDDASLTLQGDGVADDAGDAIRAVSTIIGDQAGAAGALTVTAGAAFDGGSLTVANHGAGNLTIQDGAVRTANSVIGGQSGSAGTVTVDGVDSSWINRESLIIGDSSFSLISKGDGARGTLTIRNGGEVTADSINGAAAVVGNQEGSRGNVKVDTGSIWSNTGKLIIGNAGEGIVTVLNGGALSSTTATLGAAINSHGTGNGFVTIDGQGSSWTNSGILVIGAAGQGTLNIQHGATVSDTDGVIGQLGTADQGAGEGYVNITGGSTWTNTGRLTVGSVGSGSLIVDDGTVTSHGAVIGDKLDRTLGDINGGGTVNVDSGSIWTNYGDLTVGNQTDGTLIITGTVSNDSATIAASRGSTGAVYVGGTDAKWNNSGDLTVGPQGNGTLTVKTGGTVSVGGLLHIDPMGTVNLEGGTIRTKQIADHGIFHFAGGTLEMTGDWSVDYDGGLYNVLQANQGAITFGQTVAIDGTSTLYAPVTINGGTFSVGDLNNPQLVNFQSGTLAIHSAVTIAPTSKFGATLVLNQGQTFAVRPGGLSLHPMTVDSGGEVRLRGGTLSFRDPKLDPSVDGTLDIEAGGQLTGSGQIQGILAVGQTTHAGTVYLTGGTLIVSDSVENHGLITGHGVLRADAQGQDTDWAIYNAGQMLFSGVTDVRGSVFNVSGDPSNDAAAGSIVITGGGPTTFYDDVLNDGVIKVDVGSAGGASKLVFLGKVTGSGSITGGGDVFFENVLSPGDSPATISLAANVALAPSNDLIMQLAGAPDFEYDRLNVLGNLTLGGALDVQLTDGFAAQLGDSFDLLDFASLTGAFDTVNLPSLARGLSWDDSQLYTTGTIRVVPEPGSGALMLLAALTLLLTSKHHLRKRQPAQQP